MSPPPPGSVQPGSNPAGSSPTGSPSPDPATAHADPAGPLLPGRIDIHSHLIPGVDDGCRDLDEALRSIETLQRRGYVGTVCTPHLWPELFPDNTPANVARWVDELRQELAKRGIAYRLWPGGELRLFDGVTAWLDVQGVPTLAGSNLVLVDFWEPTWPKHVNRTCAWLIDRGYQPVLAHPERIVIPEPIDPHLDRLAGMGVLMQGNFRCMTGEDGYLPDQRVRQYAQAGRYNFMALDMHRPDTLPGRLDGLDLFAQEFGQAAADRLTRDEPRRRILGDSA